MKTLTRFLTILAMSAGICSTAAAGDFQITSPAFSNGGPIPEKYGRLSENIPPPLAWSNPPPGVKFYAFVMDDPDAPSGDWTHWTLANIPAKFDELNVRSVQMSVQHPPDASPQVSKFMVTIPPDGIVEGRNSWGRDPYDGPQPPSGTHRYFFHIYALDMTLPLKPDFSRAELEAAMKGHVIGKAEIMGTYSARN